MTDSRISQFNKYIEDKRKELFNFHLARTIRSFSEFTSWSKQIITPEGINEKIVVRDFESLKESLREFWIAFHRFFNPRSLLTDDLVTLEVRKSPTAREYCTSALRDVFYISQAFTPSNAIKEEETRQFVIACRKGFVELLESDWADKSYGSEEATCLNSFFWGTDRNDSIKSLFELCMSHRGVSKLVLKQASAGRVRALFLPRSGTQTALAAAAGVDVKFGHGTLLSVRWLSA